MSVNTVDMATPERLHPAVPRDTCEHCSLREICLPGGIPVADLERLDAIVEQRRRVPRGALLFRADAPLRAVYAVRVGSFKTRRSGEEREQILGFQLPGELLGLDGIDEGRYGVDAVALEDSEVCVLPVDDLERVARAFPPLQRQIHRMMSRELGRSQDVVTMLGAMRAEERVVAFLIGLSVRFRRLGYSETNFVLRMSREEIGHYLGIKIETVSRTLTRLAGQGLIAVSGKEVRLLELEALRARLDTAVLHRMSGDKAPPGAR